MIYLKQIKLGRITMKKLRTEDMKKVTGGLQCGPRCECIIALSTTGGMSFDDAYNECTELFGRHTD
jgi:hypothetical protein